MNSFSVFLELARRLECVVMHRRVAEICGDEWQVKRLTRRHAALTAAIMEVHL
jgi:hypothetical protein